MRFDRRFILFQFLAGLFIAALIVGDIIGGKLYRLELPFYTQDISVGYLPFPLTFLITDLVNEFYGRRAARVLTFAGFACALFTILVLTLAVAVPWSEITRAADWGGMRPDAFNNIFASSTKILLASTTAFLLAQFLDIGTFNFLKRATGSRFLWLRATGSTVVSQLIDTLIINFLVWSSQFPPGKVLGLALTAYLYKLVIAIGLTPLIYLGHALMERVLQIPPVELDARGDPVEQPTPGVP